ncbi:hypothetical protein B5X24_HaOG203731 [Helicoverpa armigera]|uniref:Gustatory receptor n=1 Tax=Helicoverpa armigera TaxID=29058 RepID=A0A2W1BU09_HELAM|nr:hypothetical protein B5X24_HaOG203731 [Helicoverpa armigera]
MEELYDMIKSIGKIWKVTNKIFELKVLLHFIVAFEQLLTYTCMLLVYVKINTLTSHLIISHIAAITTYLSKIVLVEIPLCVACEEFYTLSAQTRRIASLKASHDLSTKRIWKNIQRVIDTDFQKLCVCGLFDLDAVTMVKFCFVITTYTIVSLQFALPC